MKKLTLLLLALAINPAFAAEEKCPATKEKTLPANMTVYFYSTVKNHKTYYVPMMKTVDGKLVNADRMTVPAELTLFNVSNDQPIKVKFNNVHDNVDYDVCRSIGETKKITSNTSEIFASTPSAKDFNVTPDKAEMDRFYAQIENPCKDHQAKYDQAGVASCNADQLIATSHFNGVTQYWNTKQYRHDLGFGVSVWDDATKKLKEVAEDLAVGKD